MPNNRWTANEYPLYEMVVGGKIEWCSLRQAAIFYDCGLVPVSFGTQVIDSLGDVPRPITDDDKRRISDRADEYSASK